MRNVWTREKNIHPILRQPSGFFHSHYDCSPSRFVHSALKCNCYREYNVKVGYRETPFPVIKDHESVGQNYNNIRTELSSRHETKTDELWCLRSMPEGSLTWISVDSRGRYPAKMAASWNGWQWMDDSAELIFHICIINQTTIFRLVLHFFPKFLLNAPWSFTFCNEITQTSISQDLNSGWLYVSLITSFKYSSKNRSFADFDRKEGKMPTFVIIVFMCVPCTVPKHRPTAGPHEHK